MDGELVEQLVREAIQEQIGGLVRELQRGEEMVEQGASGDGRLAFLCQSLCCLVWKNCQPVIDFISTTLIFEKKNEPFFTYLLNKCTVSIILKRTVNFFYGFLIFGRFADSAKFTFHELCHDT